MADHRVAPGQPQPLCGTTQQFVKWTRRNPSLALAVSLAFLLGVAGGMGALMQGQRARADSGVGVLSASSTTPPPWAGDQELREALALGQRQPESADP